MLLVLKVVNNILIKYQDKVRNYRIFLPINMRYNIVIKSHLVFGHGGAKAVYDELYKWSYCPCMFDDINIIIKLCLSCQRSKKYNIINKNNIPLDQAHAKYFNNIVYGDIIGPLPVS